ncbi:MAG: glycogen/starch synthase [Acidobacteria bacterium]|nr:glycogen/starch synthase [Acidobacteriota bacterium]
MRVAVISAEAVPYSKTGGLGDVAGALPKALKAVGIDSVLITPCYWQTKGEHLWNTAFDDLAVDWKGGIYPAKAFHSEANGSPTFLIDAPSLFHRDSIYGFREDHERFAFFNHAAPVLLKRLGTPPDIVHLNDWHCGFAAVELASARRHDPFGETRGRSFRSTIWLTRAASVPKSFLSSALAATSHATLSHLTVTLRR